MEKVYIRFVKPRGWNEVLAVFMRSSASRRYDPACIGWMRTSYMHSGQHGECSDSFARAKRATPEEYKDLFKEMEELGYQIIIT